MAHHGFLCINHALIRQRIVEETLDTNWYTANCLTCVWRPAGTRPGPEPAPIALLDDPVPARGNPELAERAPGPGTGSELLALLDDGSGALVPFPAIEARPDDAFFVFLPVVTVEAAAAVAFAAPFRDPFELLFSSASSSLDFDALVLAHDTHCTDSG